MTRRLLLSLMPAVLMSPGCLAQSPRERPVGMTLLFLNLGTEVIVVTQFNPDGQRGPVPGGLSVDRDEKRGGAQMTFMPGDNYPISKSVEVEWLQHGAAYKAWKLAYGSLPQDQLYSAENQKKYQEAWSKNPRYSKRIDLTPILTPEIIARARQNPKTTNVKLKVIFRDDQVSITADNEVWR